MPYIGVPFDCGAYGDLCEMVGPARAQAFVCDRWDDLRDGKTESAILADAPGELEDYVEEWFDARFPDGVPGGHAWFGVFTSDGGSPTSSCVAKKWTSKTVDSGQVRLRGRSYSTDMLVYKEIGASSTVLEDVTMPWGTLWVTSGPSPVETHNTYKDKSTGATCDTNSDADTGKAKRSLNSLFGKPPDKVLGDAEGNYYLEDVEFPHVYTCKEAGWDADCS
ncbi:MAG: hypothetical protein H6742_18275 [Alphaproteobacteria bacterium]|nr:hypothetical protein [Alphaproteobacteria bacterium]